MNKVQTYPPTKSEKIKNSEFYQPADMICANTSGFCPTMQRHRSHYSISEVEACTQKILLPYWLVVKTIMDGRRDLQLKLWKWLHQRTGRAAFGGKTSTRQQPVLLDACQCRWILKNNIHTHTYLILLFTRPRVTIPSKSYSAASHLRCPGSTLVLSISNLW
jgi:hypothetical protein